MLKEDASYARQFEALYPDGVTRRNLGDAIATALQGGVHVHVRVGPPRRPAPYRPRFFHRFTTAPDWFSV